MYAPHVLPAASDYDALYRAFRWLETRCAPALWRLRARLNARA